MTKLQVALDFFSLEDAVKIAKMVAEAGADILEIGTPLIHMEGLKKSIREIKKIASDFGQEVLVDLKLADVGYETAKKAFSLGADAITVLAAVDDNTILGTLKAKEEFGGKVMADLILSRDLKNDVDRVINLGVDYVLIHLGIDIQRKIDIVSYINSLGVSIPSEKLAVAGGITLDKLDKFAELKPAIIIVGRAITRSENPYLTTKKFLQRLDLLKLRP